MNITDIFNEIFIASGHAKLTILEREKQNQLLKDIIKATYEPHWIFGVKLKGDIVGIENGIRCDDLWHELLSALYNARDGITKGNATRGAIAAILTRADIDTSKFMQAVVNRHMNIGCDKKTYNRIWPNLISTFECQLAEKFDSSRIANVEHIAVEPKLDGVRCLAFVDTNGATLYTRSGKQIINFENVCTELSKLVTGPMVFDGELMSSDFSAMMGQVFRKKDIDPTNVVYNIFDCMPRNMWDTRRCTLTCLQSREILEDMCINAKCKHVRLIVRHIVNPSALAGLHKGFVKAGLEGSMVKLLNSTYVWKRDWNVMKVKDFFTVDLPIASFNEGTKRMVGHLGSFVVYLDGVEVKVERGHMTKPEARHIWLHRNEYRGKIIEINYQEVTRDGSLRLPVFMRFRRDKEEV